MRANVSFFIICTVFSYVSLAKSDFKEDPRLRGERPDTMYNKETDYSKFTGRVTDRNEAGNIFKVSTENKNFKFFRIGDWVEFKIAKIDMPYCESYIRKVDDEHFVIYVKDLSKCWEEDDYFRRGTMLFFDSPVLKRRVMEASKYRSMLLKRREDFLKQLNGINYFVFNYNEERIKVGTLYDRKIEELKKAKQNAFDHLLTKRRDQLRLQRELAFNLDKIDKEVEFYRVENSELFADRWHLDHDLGIPVGRRPQKHKSRGPN